MKLSEMLWSGHGKVLNLFVWLAFHVTGEAPVDRLGFAASHYPPQPSDCNTPMADEVEGYIEDLTRQVATLRDSLDKIDRAKEDKKGNIISGAETILGDAKATYSALINAFKELDPALKPKYQPAGVQFKKDLGEITEKLKAERNSQNRKDLNLKDDQRTTDELLAEAADVQKKSKESTNRSKDIVKQINETGEATLNQLTEDGKKMETVHEDLEEMDSDLKIAQAQLKSIARKLTRDKIIRGLCILACLVILAILIWLIADPAAFKVPAESVTTPHSSASFQRSSISLLILSVIGSMWLYL